MKIIITPEEVTRAVIRFIDEEFNIEVQTAKPIVTFNQMSEEVEFQGMECE